MIECVFLLSLIVEVDSFKDMPKTINTDGFIFPNTFSTDYLRDGDLTILNEDSYLSGTMKLDTNGYVFDKITVISKTTDHYAIYYMDKSFFEIYFYPIYVIIILVCVTQIKPLMAFLKIQKLGHKLNL